MTPPATAAGRWSVRATLTNLARSTRRRIDTFLDSEAEGSSQNWVERLVTSLVTTALVVVTMHFAIVLALGHGWLLEFAVVGTVVGVGLLLSGSLLLLYWRARVQPDDVRPLVLGVLIGSLTAGVALEAFCAAQLLLWRAEVVEATQAAADPDLLQVERLYGWQLLNSIPLLSVPNTLGLDRPVVFSDQLSGALLLTFKLTVLIPLIGLLVAGYGFADKRFAAVRDARVRRTRKDASARWLSMDDDIWPVALYATLAAVATGAAVWLGFDPESPIRVLAEQHLPAEWRDVSLGWIDDYVLPFIAVMLLGTALSMALEQTDYLSPGMPGGESSEVGWSAAIIGAVLLATAVTVAVTVLLIRTGLSRPDEALPRGEVLGTALSFNVWHVLNGIPGLEIPETLNWKLKHDLDDAWSGAALLLYKATLLFALVFATTRIVQPHLRRRWMAGPGTLTAAGEFARLADAGGRRVTELETSTPDASRWLARDACATLVRRLEEASSGVHELFGAGNAADAADAVVGLLDRRTRRLALFRPSVLQGTQRGGADKTETEADRAAYAEALRIYRKAARRALRDELAGPGSSRRQQ